MKINPKRKRATPASSARPPAAPAPARSPREVEIDGVRLHLSHAHDLESQWIGQGEVLKQLLACWMVVDEKDQPLTPRLIGAPGIGKTALAIAGAKTLGRELYIYQCTADTRPEDLLVTPVLAESGKIAYHASALVTAMLRGGVCISTKATA